MRFWKALDAGDDGLPVWLGAAVFDDGLGVSHYTGQVTHHTAPDIDAERDLLTSDLALAKKVVTSYSVSGVGPTFFARNGGGDPYFTDGDIEVSRLVSGCAAEVAPRRPCPAARDCGQERGLRGAKILVGRSVGGTSLRREHNRLALIEQHPVFEHVGDGAGEHAALDVAPLAHQIVGRVAMADALDVLLDDRALVEVGSHEMRRRPDQLDAAWCA